MGRERAGPVRAVGVGFHPCCCLLLLRAAFSVSFLLIVWQRDLPVLLPGRGPRRTERFSKTFRSCS